MVHGCGVNTPIAAEVAAATWGLAIDEHIPNPEMLVPADTSVTVAIGLEHPKQVDCDVAVNVAGVVPNGHISEAPVTTTIPIRILLYNVTFIESAKLTFLK
jgi:hypothetical protein